MKITLNLSGRFRSCCGLIEIGVMMTQVHEVPYAVTDRSAKHNIAQKVVLPRISRQADRRRKPEHSKTHPLVPSSILVIQNRCE